MKKTAIGGALVVVALLIGFGVYLQSMEKGGASADPEIVSLKGLHWHADLAIVVKGSPVVIPANVGLEGGHNPIHTHDGEPNIIHMEFPGIVRVDDLKLGEFFRIWKKEMRSFGNNMKMTVNGVENTEFENYHMKDKDKIVLSFD
ncbi:MAG: hypothetical protein Q7K40_00870 [bacterium]|nr:hypothetical protein [bacterium]